MTLDDLKSSLPAYAKDLRLNLESVLSEGGAPGLDAKQIRAVALASAIAARHIPLTRAIEAFAAEQLDAGELDGVRAAAAMMGMTNVYYRFTHLVANKEYESLRTSLRMNVMAKPGIEKVAFEAASLAVSAVNGCGACLDAHEDELRKRNVPNTQIQAALRIGAVVNAVSRAIQAEAALAA